MSSSDLPKLEIFYIRHASTTRVYDGRDACDCDISDVGVQEAELLADRLAGLEFDAVLCSPLVRCVKTAAAVCRKLAGHPAIEIVPELIEKGSTPNYAGAGIEYLSRYYDNIIQCPDLIFGEAPGVFPNKDKPEIMDRARAVVDYLRERFPYGKRILIFSHGSFGNSLLPSAVGIREEDFIFNIYHTSVSKIQYTPDGRNRIVFMNDVSHLIPIKPDYMFTL